MYSLNSLAMHVRMTHLPTPALRVPYDASLDAPIAQPDYVSAHSDMGGIIRQCNVHPQKVGVNSWTADADQHQQKGGHRKILIAGATAVRRPVGGVFLVGLDARHDRFLLPTLPVVAAQKLAMRPPVLLRHGWHASRRAPPDFVGQNKAGNVAHFPPCPRTVCDGTSGGKPPLFLDSLRSPEAVRLTRKVGGRAPRGLLAVRGVAPRTSTAALGRLNPLGRILLGGSPQPQPVPARAGSVLTDSDRVRGLVPLLPSVGCPSRLRARSSNGWGNGSHFTRFACCAPAAQVCELRFSHALLTSLSLRATLANIKADCPCCARTECIFRYAKFVLLSEKPISIAHLFLVSITSPSSQIAQPLQKREAGKSTRTTPVGDTRKRAPSGFACNRSRPSACAAILAESLACHVSCRPQALPLLPCGTGAFAAFVSDDGLVKTLTKRKGDEHGD